MVLILVILDVPLRQSGGCAIGLIVPVLILVILDVPLRQKKQHEKDL